MEPPPSPIIAWAATTGEAGMRTQARGLAAAVAGVVVEKVTPPALAWPPGRARALARDFAAPWPDLLVTCGRRSAFLASWLRRRGARRMLAVHVQDPRRPLDPFDLVVAMAHDRIAAGGKVIKVATALHDVTAASLATAAGEWRERLAPLGRPLAGVLIGGTTSRGGFSPTHRRALADGLAALRRAGWSLAVAPSRRTPAVLIEELAVAFFRDEHVWIWPRVGDNPYRGVLALADRLVVTGDSVSMISEALASGAPVEVFDLAMPHFSQFIDPLLAAGALRRFTGGPGSPPARQAVDATPLAAAVVSRLLQARGFEPRTGVAEESCSRSIQASVT